jgi:hypothetical protein
MKNKKTIEGFNTGQPTINTLERVLFKKSGPIQDLLGQLKNKTEHIIEKSNDNGNYYKLKEEGAKPYFPAPWKPPENWKLEGNGIESNDMSFNVYWNNNLSKASINSESGGLDYDVDPSGYVLRCIDLVKQDNMKYARIDVSGCWGNDEIEDSEQNTSKPNSIIVEAENIHDIITGPQTRGSQSDNYKNITCTIVRHEKNWICASNCVFKGSNAANIGDVDGGNNQISDLASESEKLSGKTWRIPPPSGVIKHSTSHNFKCNSAGGMYSQAGSPDIEPRKCLFGKMQESSETSSLNCGDAAIVRGCQVVTDVNDKSCLPRTKTIDGKIYKYCPVLCNPEGLGGSNRCTQHSQCRKHLFKRELDDTVKNVPWENPFEVDALGYNRIEVDEQGSSVNQDSREAEANFYSNLMNREDDTSTGEPRINVDVLEGSTLSGLYNYFVKDIKLGEMENFLRGIRSYFRANNEDPDWMNDNDYGLSETAEDASILESETTPFTYRYTQGGTHLLSKDLMMNPRNFKNDNQYIAMARKILYDRKVGTGEKILNPETVPKADLILLGKIHHKIQLLDKELENQYLSEEGRTEITTKINRLNQKGSLLIKDIENRERVFERTVKEERSRPFRQNDRSYVPFRNQGMGTYTTTRGQVLDTPTGVGANF